MTKADELRDSLRKVIARITYKPGWEFTVVPRPINNYDFPDEFEVIVMVTYRRINKYGQAETLAQYKTLYVGVGDITEAFAFHSLENLIRAAEEFEFREWLKFDGEKVRNER